MHEFNELIKVLLIYYSSIIIVSILFGIFWLWMLIDCIRHETNEGNERLIWVVAIIFTNLLGALLYFFMRWARRIKTGEKSVVGEPVAREMWERKLVINFATAYRSASHADLQIKRIVKGVPFEAFYADDSATELSAKFYQLPELSQMRQYLEKNSNAAYGHKNALVLAYAGAVPKAFKPENELEPMLLNCKDTLHRNFDKGVWLLSEADGKFFRLI